MYLGGDTIQYQPPLQEIFIPIQLANSMYWFPLPFQLPVVI